MIFHQYKAIFLHIGKTAGTAIESWLGNPYWDFKEPHHDVLYGFNKTHNFYMQHATSEAMLRMADPAVVKQYYKFTVIRNPYARLVSCYYYSVPFMKNDEQDIERYMQSLPAKLKNTNASYGLHETPQVKYTHLYDRLFCDHVAYFEQLPASIEPVKKALGLGDLPPRKNTKRHKSWPDQPIAAFYTPETKRIIQDLYAADFMAYGYSASPEQLQPDGSGVKSSLR